MSKEHNFENEEMFEQPEFNYYYAPPMFNYSEDDEDEYMRSCCQPMMPYMMPGMQPGMMMPGMQPTMQTEAAQEMPKANLVGMEPGMAPGLQSPSLAASPINPATSQQQATVFNQGFLQAYLNKLIGKFVRIEFLIGTTTLTDRSGIIEEVGVNYIVLRDPAGSRIVGDLYSIKFVTVFAQQ